MLVACYCCVECQREDWPADTKQCKLNRKFEPRDQTEETYRFALDGKEKSPEKDHEDMKRCARNSAILLFQELDDKKKTRELVKAYPHLLEEGGGFGVYVRNYIQ